MLIGDPREQVADHIEPRRALVVALDRPPRNIDEVGVREHLVFRAGVVLPFGEREHIGFRQLPPPHRVFQPRPGVNDRKDLANLTLL